MPRTATGTIVRDKDKKPIAIRVQIEGVRKRIRLPAGCSEADAEGKRARWSQMARAGELTLKHPGIARDGELLEANKRARTAKNAKVDLSHIAGEQKRALSFARLYLCEMDKSLAATGTLDASLASSIRTMARRQVMAFGNASDARVADFVESWILAQPDTVPGAVLFGRKPRTSRT